MTGTTSMRPKKGALSATILVGIIIATISIIILVFAFKGIYSTTGTTLTDSICTVNAAVKSYIKAMPLVACSISKVTIEADDWGACDPDETKGWEDDYKRTGREYYLRYCATKQFYSYANSCWERYGKGDLDLSMTETGQRFECYKITVKDLEEDDHIFLEPGALDLRTDFREQLTITIFDKSLKKDDTRIRRVLGGRGNGDYSIYYFEGVEGSVIWINVWPPPGI